MLLEIVEISCGVNASSVVDDWNSAYVLARCGDRSPRGPVGGIIPQADLYGPPLVALQPLVA